MRRVRVRNRVRYDASGVRREQVRVDLSRRCVYVTQRPCAIHTGINTVF